ncbi:DNA repair helicase XPB [Cohnella sp. REN36]|uniref:DNA repair helicase XPB n=1 Tax=Cohnella sp. REN36 TaxID=2887347 RepID=UPI001D138ABA|nr:DNA repair helicase XPB [Cohnella sp. REN36]MCC3372979.1 DEAD/DEAH box helicase [Cohnella sp. REN36]
MTMPTPAIAPLIVQSDGTLLLDERLPRAEEALALLREVAELRKRPGSLHTYAMTPVTMWNAAASGWTPERVLAGLRAAARYGVPAALEREVQRVMGRYGQLRLVRLGDELRLTAQDPAHLREIAAMKEIRGWLRDEAGDGWIGVCPEARGWLKRELAARGWPVVDEAGYRSGEALRMDLCETSGSGRPIRLRDYQAEAVEAFAGSTAGDGGSGVVVLPCGAGKTWVGMAAMARLRCETLILTPNGISVTQWIRELLRNTTLTEADIGAYTGDTKQVRPVTVATYQVLTHRQAGKADNPHWQLFVDRNWGLIVYDEVHLLPAPVFRLTADLQATRRLGLTATLVREDGLASDVFALVGPKRYDAPWKSLEQQGWIAEAACREVRVPLGGESAERYAAAPARARHRIAGENPAKTEVVRRLLARHDGEPTLVIGQYLSQLRDVSEGLGIPLVTGEMPQQDRQRLFDRFNSGEVGVLALSKVANFAVDLPDAAVAIQISGSFGSRQEEAQRLGRILRPKRDGAGATFYSLVSEETDEVEFARKRQRFLLEQGYEYEVSRWPAGAAEGGAKG